MWLRLVLPIHVEYAEPNARLCEIPPNSHFDRRQTFVGEDISACDNG
jgi:hypothetical protein